jgi:hypothetical protein
MRQFIAKLWKGKFMPDEKRKCACACKAAPKAAETQKAEPVVKQIEWRCHCGKTLQAPETPTPEGWYSFISPLDNKTRHSSCPECCARQKRISERVATWKAIIARYQELGKLIDKAMVEEGIFATPRLEVNHEPNVTPGSHPMIER